MCKELSTNSFANASGWLASESSLAHVSEWLDTVASVLVGSQRVADALTKGRPCLVHCSDGWDRTSQISALSALLLDPFYRTRRGFSVLIEKEWLRFGHKFKTRSGATSKSGEIGSVHINVTGGKKVRRNSGKGENKSLGSQVRSVRERSARIFNHEYILDFMTKTLDTNTGTLLGIKTRTGHSRIVR